MTYDSITMTSFQMSYYNRIVLFSYLQVIKNLLFVAKVIYEISPEYDSTATQEVEESKEEETKENGEDEKDEDKDEDQKEDEEEVNTDRPPSLLWMMKKLSLMAKREAADTPKIPLKVNTHTQHYHTGSLTNEASFCN